MHSKLKSSYASFLGLGGFIVFFFLILTVLGEGGLVKLKKLYAQRDQLRLENQAIFDHNQKLANEIHLLKQKTFSERLIREKLGYVKPQELVVLVDP